MKTTKLNVAIVAMAISCLASCKNNEAQTTDSEMNSEMSSSMTDTAYVVPTDSTVVDSTTTITP